MLIACTLLLLGAAPAPQSELEIWVAGKAYTLPAAGREQEAADPLPPLHADTLATIAVWRAFAWDAEKRKYAFRFGAGAGSSVTVLTADSSAGALAQELDQAAELVAGFIGADQLRRDYVAILCNGPESFARAVDLAADQALTRTDDPIARAHIDGDWRAAAKQGPTFYQPLAGVVGCMDGNSEKWAPNHELVRGFAQVALLRHAPNLVNVLPIMAGLSWNVELQVCGDILSVPNVEDFQFDIGRGAWSASKIAAILKKVDKEVKKEQKRDLALDDFPYLGVGSGASLDGAGVAWAVSRHLARHHGARLPALLTALSREVVALNTVRQEDGSEVYTLAPGYQLTWQQTGKVFAAELPDYRFTDLMDCITSSCSTCKAGAPN